MLQNSYPWKTHINSFIETKKNIKMMFLPHIFLKIPHCQIIALQFNCCHCLPYAILCVLKKFIDQIISMNSMFYWKHWEFNFPHMAHMDMSSMKLF